jgi:hypothetical protein
MAKQATPTTGSTSEDTGSDHEPETTPYDKIQDSITEYLFEESAESQVDIQLLQGEIQRLQDKLYSVMEQLPAHNADADFRKQVVSFATFYQKQYRPVEPTKDLTARQALLLKSYPKTWQ